jgi:hypothetical protein
MQNHQSDGVGALLAARRAPSVTQPGSRARLAGISTIALAVALASAAFLATPASAAHSKPNEVDCPKLTSEILSASADEIIVEDGTCELQALSTADLDNNAPLGGGSGGDDPGGDDPGGGDPGGDDPGGGGDPRGGGDPGGGDPGGGGSASGGSAAVGDHTKTGEDASDAGSGAGQGAIGAGQGAISAGQGAIGGDGKPGGHGTGKP